MIDYLRIAEAIKFYKIQGYTPIEVPWVVDPDIMRITLPVNRRVITCDLGKLVGSAEQGFLQLVKNEKLKGKFQATTPCFRDEMWYDELHRCYFVKTELFNNLDTSYASLMKTIENANDFFSFSLKTRIIETKEECSSPRTKISYDIVSEDGEVELGSYGIRNHPSLGSWIFGTGLAEPRFSSVLKGAKNV